MSYVSVQEDIDKRLVDATGDTKINSRPPNNYARGLPAYIKSGSDTTKLSRKCGPQRLKPLMGCSPGKPRPVPKKPKKPKRDKIGTLADLKRRNAELLSLYNIHLAQIWKLFEINAELRRQIDTKI